MLKIVVTGFKIRPPKDEVLRLWNTMDNKSNLYDWFYDNAEYYNIKSIIVDLYHIGYDPPNWPQKLWIDYLVELDRI